MSLTETPTTAPATATTRTVVNRVLSAAFRDDPVFAWLIPDRAERREVLEPLFDTFAEGFARHEETHVVTTPYLIAGVAMWAPPGAAGIHPEDEAAFDERIRTIAGRNLHRFQECIGRMAEVHPHEPGWYLQFLGVDPAHQGRGLGSIALRAVLDRADAAGEPAYLEATTPRNRALYERHGFGCLAEVRLPDGPSLYSMWREPQARQIS